MAAIAQLGERQTEDVKVPGSIPGLGNGLMHAFCICTLFLFAQRFLNQRVNRQKEMPRPGIEPGTFRSSV